MTVTASLVVRLGGAGADNGLLKAEIDGREDGLNGGRTQFFPGDDVHYLVYIGSNTVLTGHDSTLGVISSLGLRTRPVEERVQFASGQREATLGYPVASGLSVDFMGAHPGTPQLRGDTRLVLPEEGLGIATVTYTTSFRAYRLSNLPGTVNGKADYSVVIELKGEVAA